MIKINVNGNRSDIISYVSYYSCEELAQLLDVSQDEIIYETTVTDYFLHGDITFESEVIVKITLTDNYFNYIKDITDIVVKYVSFFTNKCQVYYEVLDSRLVYVYEVKNSKKVDADEHCCCHGHEDHHCGCGHHHGEEHECHCEEDECDCGCQSGGHCCCEHEGDEE